MIWYRPLTLTHHSYRFQLYIQKTWNRHEPANQNTGYYRLDIVYAVVADTRRSRHKSSSPITHKEGQHACYTPWHSMEEGEVGTRLTPRTFVSASRTWRPRNSQEEGKLEQRAATFRNWGGRIWRPRAFFCRPFWRCSPSWDVTVFEATRDALSSTGATGTAHATREPARKNPTAPCGARQMTAATAICCSSLLQHIVPFFYFCRGLLAPCGSITQAGSSTKHTYIHT